MSSRGAFAPKKQSPNTLCVPMLALQLKVNKEFNTVLQLKPNALQDHKIANSKEKTGGAKKTKGGED